MYRRGDDTKDGHKIASIAAQDEDLLVYITDSDQIRYITVSNAFAAKIDIGIVGKTMSKLKRMLDSCTDKELKSKLNDRIPFQIKCEVYSLRALKS